LEHEVEQLAGTVKDQRQTLDQQKVQIQAFKKVYGDFNEPVKECRSQEISFNFGTERGSDKNAQYIYIASERPEGKDLGKTKNLSLAAALLNRKRKEAEELF